LIDRDALCEEDDLGFATRSRLQKFAYLAQDKFGSGSKYNFSIYKHGPYSPDLTNDYYRLYFENPEEWSYCLPFTCE
jgi:uncharacterized protein YwgA